MASDGAVPGYGLSAPMTRRAVLGGLTLLPLAAAGGILRPLPPIQLMPLMPPTASYQYLSAHQAAVLDAALPPADPRTGRRPGETSPGAHDANVVRYIDIMLAAFSVSPPKVHAGRPWITAPR